MNDTITKLIKLGLYNEFKSAMEIIASEIVKLESEWDKDALNTETLNYDSSKIYNIELNFRAGNYGNNKQIYLNDLEDSHLHPDAYYEKNKQKYLNDLEDNYLQPARGYSISEVNGISFGVIRWNPWNRLKGRNNFFSTKDYDEYMEKVESIDFYCFHGKTPQEILDILDKTEEHKRKLSLI